MGHSQTIREARARLGISNVEAADYVGINTDWYWDLENFDDELTMTLSVSQFRRLCGLLRLTPSKLLGGEPRKGRIGPNGLYVGVLEYCRSRQWSVEEFSQHAGWDVQPFMDAPVATLQEWSLDCLRDVGAVLGVNWLAAIDDPVAP